MRRQTGIEVKHKRFRRQRELAEHSFIGSCDSISTNCKYYISDMTYRERVGYAGCIDGDGGMAGAMVMVMKTNFVFETRVYQMTHELRTVRFSKCA
jgi:hypothetical protein